MKKTAFNWLLVNLLSFYTKHNKWLQQISGELLTDLITCPDLVVIQTEFALYALLKVWVFLKLHPDYYDESDNANRANDLCNQACIYFEQLQGKGKGFNYFECPHWFRRSHYSLCENFPGSSKTPFLLTEEGAPFAKPFRSLRLQHLIYHPIDIKIILADKIIPREWLYEPVLMQWHSIIKIDNSADFG